MVRHYANGTPKPHQGWDFAAKVGTAAYAIAKGRVEFVHSGGDYGNRICIRFEHSGKVYYSFYAHMHHIYKTVGANLDLNDEIGSTGKSGNAMSLPVSEDHLHFEIRTIANPGIGLTGRVSPIVIFGTCPLYSPIPG